MLALCYEGLIFFKYKIYIYTSLKEFFDIIIIIPKDIVILKKQIPIKINFYYKIKC